jgi:hypothetical protein
MDSKKRKAKAAAPLEASGEEWKQQRTLLESRIAQLQSRNATLERDLADTVEREHQGTVRARGLESCISALQSRNAALQVDLTEMVTAVVDKDRQLEQALRPRDLTYQQATILIPQLAKLAAEGLMAFSSEAARSEPPDLDKLDGYTQAACLFFTVHHTLTCISIPNHSIHNHSILSSLTCVCAVYTHLPQPPGGYGTPKIDSPAPLRLRFIVRATSAIPAHSVRGETRAGVAQESLFWTSQHPLTPGGGCFWGEKKTKVSK